MSKTANLSLVCERRNILESPPNPFYSLPRLWSHLPPPPLFLGDEGRVRWNWGGVCVWGERESAGRFFICTPPPVIPCDVSHKQCSAAGVLRHVAPPHTQLVFEIECRGARWWPHVVRNRREWYCASCGKHTGSMAFFAVCCDNSVNDIVMIITIGIITIVIIY